MPPIALITDFGIHDWFAGEMKGVILSILPEAVIIDITHQISPADIRTAAFMLLACYRSFPSGTVFCSAVDPGAGSSRRALAVKCGPYFFVGPDNGCLSWVTQRTEDVHCHSVIDKRFSGIAESSTFSGRDLFGPVAAHIASGVALSEFGPQIFDQVNIPFPMTKTTEYGSVRGEIIFIDRFGNAITNIESSLNEKTSFNRLRLSNGAELPFAAFYQEVKPGEAMAYCGSAGFIEIAVNRGSALSLMHLSLGESVELLHLVN
jgi:S-adenosyl-L-methionine hydrolase (adenosine-forming)